MTKKQPITVWEFDDAPADLKALSTNGGDEDWLVLIPPGYGDATDGHWRIGWLDHIGCSAVDIFKHPGLDGWYVAIGSHA